MQGLQSSDYLGDAEIILEAYNRINIERIELGKIKDYAEVVKSHDLPFEVPVRAKINFRLKVIDPKTYRLLGLAENLKEEKYAKSMLELNTDNENVQNIYQIDFDNINHPVLDLNPELKGCADKLKPIIAEMALKDILTYLLIIHGDDFEDNKWFKFASTLIPYENVNSNTDTLEWINQVLNKFSRKEVIQPIKKKFT